MNYVRCFADHSPAELSSVTSESSDQPTEQNNVLEESDAIEPMDIETVSRKRTFSEVNKPHYIDNLVTSFGIV